MINRILEKLVVMSLIFIMVCGGIAILRMPEVFKGGIETRVLRMEGEINSHDENISDLFQIILRHHPRKQEEGKYKTSTM